MFVDDVFMFWHWFESTFMFCVLLPNACTTCYDDVWWISPSFHASHHNIAFYSIFFSLALQSSLPYHIYLFFSSSLPPPFLSILFSSSSRNFTMICIPASGIRCILLLFIPPISAIWTFFSNACKLFKVVLTASFQQLPRFNYKQCTATYDAQACKTSFSHSPRFSFFFVSLFDFFFLLRQHGLQERFNSGWLYLDLVSCLSCTSEVCLVKFLFGLGPRE